MLLFKDKRMVKTKSTFSIVMRREKSLKKRDIVCVWQRERERGESGKREIVWERRLKTRDYMCECVCVWEREVLKREIMCVWSVWMRERKRGESGKKTGALHPLETSF